MSKPVQSENLWTAANVVTIIRILFVPVLLVIMLSPWPEWFPTTPGLEAVRPWVATALFIILAATDSLDGYLARSRNEVTSFGKFMDPLADKLLVCSTLIALVELSILPAWVVLIIISRDFIISGIRLVAASKGEVIAASWYGKVKTVFQMIAIVMFMIMGSLGHLFGPGFQKVFLVLSWVVMGIALVLTIVSLVDYFYHARYLLGFSKPEVDAAAAPVKADSEAARSALNAEKLDARCRELAAHVVSEYSTRGMTCSTCESLTGGLISGYITGVSGSSSVLAGGLTTYMTRIKASLAGVSEERLAETGPVDEVVVREMAEGTRRECGVNVGVAVTGIAGPTGDEPGKPVGTVWFGLASAKGSKTERRQFEGGREEVRLQTVAHALELLLSEIDVSL